MQKTSLGEVTKEFAKTALDMEKLWNAPRHFTAGLASEGELQGLGKKRKRGGPNFLGRPNRKHRPHDPPITPYNPP